MFALENITLSFWRIFWPKLSKSLKNREKSHFSTFTLNPEFVHFFENCNSIVWRFFFRQMLNFCNLKLSLAQLTNFLCAFLKRQILDFGYKIRKVTQITKRYEKLGRMSAFLFMVLWNFETLLTHHEFRYIIVLLLASWNGIGRHE